MQQGICYLNVILLDSKCYSLLGNECTSGGFWKSTWKVLATSCELYRKLTGHKTDPGRASIDLTQDESSEESDASFPSSKKPFLNYKTPDIHQKLNEIARGVSTMQGLVTFMKNIKQAFKCVVCKGVVSAPTMAAVALQDVKGASTVGWNTTPLVLIALWSW